MTTPPLPPRGGCPYERSEGQSHWCLAAELIASERDALARELARTRAYLEGLLGEGP